MRALEQSRLVQTEYDADYKVFYASLTTMGAVVCVQLGITSFVQPMPKSYLRNDRDECGFCGAQTCGNGCVT